MGVDQKKLHSYSSFIGTVLIRTPFYLLYTFTAYLPSMLPRSASLGRARDEGHFRFLRQHPLHDFTLRVFKLAPSKISEIASF